MILGLKERAEVAALVCEICGDPEVFATAPGHEAQIIFEQDVPTRCWCITHWLWGKRGTDNDRMAIRPAPRT